MCTHQFCHPMVSVVIILFQDVMLVLLLHGDCRGQSNFLIYEMEQSQTQLTSCWKQQLKTKDKENKQTISNKDHTSLITKTNKLLLNEGDLFFFSISTKQQITDLSYTSRPSKHLQSGHAQNLSIQTHMKLKRAEQSMKLNNQVVSWSAQEQYWMICSQYN